MIKELQRQLLPPRLIMKITALNETDGTVTVQSDSGHILQVIGSGSIDSRVYVQDGRVLGSAPDLPFYEIEV